VLGYLTIDQAEERFGADSKMIVWDEYVGMWITLFALPKSIVLVFLAFIVFRVFDVLKPFPIRRLESLPGAVGVMADDVVAGIYSNLVLWVLVLVRFIPIGG